MSKDLFKLAEQLATITNTKWDSAGSWYYNDKGKKVAKIADPDNTPVKKHTNLLKTQLDNKLIVLDADGCDLSLLEKLFPSIAKTFTTQTTAPTKRHFYFKANHAIRPTRTTGLDADGPYDIISSGIMFEGHSLKGQEVEWKIVNDAPIAELTPSEIEKIQLVVKSSKHTSQGKGAFFINKDMKASVDMACRVDKLEDMSTKEWNKMARLVMPMAWVEDHRKSRKRLELPDLNHLTINSIAYKLSYNAGIPTEMRDKFLDKLLSEYYGIDTASTETIRRLDKQILPNLPVHGDLVSELYNVEEFVDMLRPTEVDGWGVVKYIENKDVYFMEISTVTLKPRRRGRYDVPAMTFTTLAQLRGYSKDDLALIPLVKVIDDPFSEPVQLDLENEIDTINLAINTSYYEQAIPVAEMPDNPITRLVTSYFGVEWSDLYYHWLANAMYNSRAPQTVPVLVSPKEDEGATGKSSLAQALPTRLIHATGTIDPDSTEKGWGDVVSGKRLLCLNDVKNLKADKLKSLQAFIRDRTTGGARRHDNMKYGGFQASTATVAFSFSANWVPSIDEHDRRFWYVLPDSLYNAKGSKLSLEDSAQINQWFEHTPLETHIEEVQEIANYLLYIYKEYYTGKEYHKNFFYLYNEAPHTKGRQMALRQQKTYSEMLIPAIKQGPKALQDIMGDDVGDFIPFIAMQWYGGYVGLPWDFLAVMQGKFHPDRVQKMTKAGLANSLQIETEKFTTLGKNYLNYKNPLMLATFGLDEDYGNFTQQQIKLPVSEEVHNEYVKWVNEKSVAKAAEEAATPSMES
jgi:hypothetical protein